jgi:hypothetical protein
MTTSRVVTNNFIDAFAVALSVDATDKVITFSDGTPTGKITVTIPTLWLTDTEQLLKTRHGEMNITGWLQAIKMCCYASDVPNGAVLAANNFIDVADVAPAGVIYLPKQYRIESSFLENEIWQVLLTVPRTSML